MTPPRTPQQIGRSNRRRGSDWQEACARYLREHGYPNAEYVKRNGANDLSGTGDVAVECTLEGWDKVYIKLDQADRDKAYRNLGVACVWKKYVNKTTGRGKTDPGTGAIIMRAQDFWSLMRDLEAYQRADGEFHDGWERGFSAGFASRDEILKGETSDTDIA